MNGFGMGLGWFIPLLLIVGVIYFFNENNRRDDRKKERSAKEVIDMRLAKGEISKEEHAELLKALNG
jgi:putative membrane protein